MNALAPTLRVYAPQDAEAVHAMARALPEWFNESGLAQMRLDLAEHDGVLAEVAGVLAGFAIYCVRPDAAEITWLGVERSLHGRGIGSALCDAVERALVARGVTVLEVATLAETIDYAPYAATRRFYADRGFERVRVDVAFWGPENDRLLLRKSLARTRAGG